MHLPPLQAPTYSPHSVDDQRRSSHKLINSKYEGATQEIENTRKAQTDIRMYFRPMTTEASPSNSNPGTSIFSSKAGEGQQSSSESWKTSQTYKCLDSTKLLESSPWHQPSVSHETSLTPQPTASSFRNTMIDLSLMPQPLRFNEPHTFQSDNNRLSTTSSSLSEDSSILMSAALDTDGTFRKSVIMSLFERGNLGEMDEFHPTINIDLQNRPKRSMSRDFKQWNSSSSDEGMRMRKKNGEEPIIYFMPSPAMISSLGPPTRTAYINHQNTDPAPTYSQENGTSAESADTSSDDDAASPLLLPRVSTKALKILGSDSSYSSNNPNFSTPLPQSKYHPFISHPHIIIQTDPKAHTVTAPPRNQQPKRVAWRDPSPSPSPSPEPISPPTVLHTPKSSFSSSSSSSYTSSLPHQTPSSSFSPSLDPLTSKQKKDKEKDKKKKGKGGGKFIKLMQKYSKQVEGLQMIQ